MFVCVFVCVCVCMYANIDLLVCVCVCAEPLLRDGDADPLRLVQQAPGARDAEEQQPEEARELTD